MIQGLGVAKCSNQGMKLRSQRTSVHIIIHAESAGSLIGQHDACP
jgi:ribosomal protein S3